MKARLHRICALALCLALLAALALPAMALQADDWALPELEQASQAGILPASLESADLTQRLTRQEMCQVVVHTFSKLVGKTLYPASTRHFTDTDNADICIAQELGIVSGYPDGTFRPNATITREEFCQVTASFFAALGWDTAAPVLARFTDRGQISTWARNAAAAAVKLEIVAGNTDGTVAPQQNSSCEQTLAMLLRAYRYLEKLLGKTAEQPAPAQPENYTCSAWAAEEMAALYGLGLLPQELQAADLTKPITRRQICAAAVLVYQKLTGLAEIKPAGVHFSDTDDATVNAAYELALISGYPDGTFQPAAQMTREQFFVIVKNLLTACGWTAPSDAAALETAFTDAATIGGWAQEAVGLLYRLQIVYGTTGGAMAPTAAITRQEGLAMFWRAYQYVSPWYAENPLARITGPLVANSTAQAVVELALRYVGYPYTWAGASPETGFDCSGFTSYIYKQFGYTLNRTAAGQINDGIGVARDQLLPGDIIIMSVHGDITRVGHVAIYIGDGKMVHAQSSATGVCVTPVSNYNARYITARRIIY